MYKKHALIPASNLKSIWVPIVACLLCMPAAAPSMAEEKPFDTDRGIWLFDTDLDSYPDLTEELEGTNPFDTGDHPGRFDEEALPEDSPDKVGFPRSTCRSGYRQAGPRLCISQDEQNARSYANAASFCRVIRGRVCQYEDLRYLYVKTTLDASYNPNGNYLGDWVADDKVLCGNKSITFNNDPDIANFDGTCNRFPARSFWCCHDDE